MYLSWMLMDLQLLIFLLPQTNYRSMQNLENQIGSLCSSSGFSFSPRKMSVVFLSQMLPNAAMCFGIRVELAHILSDYQGEAWGQDDRGSADHSKMV